VKWISVKDKMPDAGKDVLVYINGDDPEIDVSYHTFEVLHKENIWHYGNQLMFETSWFQEVTHWMPLPEPPKDTP